MTAFGVEFYGIGMHGCKGSIRLKLIVSKEEL